ncbi:MAG TPA: hypothetical protein VL635_19585, partial [Trinickia sp.]|nr:hypothetical protein [Trinickia sp.]
MALDEAALDTLGLSTLWVRRGGAAAPNSAADDGMATAAREAAHADEPPTPSAMPRREVEQYPIDTARDEVDFAPAGAVPVRAKASPVGRDNDVATLDWDALEARVS